MRADPGGGRWIEVRELRGGETARMEKQGDRV